MSRRKGSRRARSAAKPGASTLAACAAAALIALVSALFAALIFSAAALRSGDPAALAPYLGLAALGVCALAAGIAATRLAKAPKSVCAAIGAAIGAAALLLSLIPALPQVALPLPKALGAAIPALCAVAGGALAAPRRRRRR